MEPMVGDMLPTCLYTSRTFDKAYGAEHGVHVRV